MQRSCSVVLALLCTMPALGADDDPPPDEPAPAEQTGEAGDEDGAVPEEAASEEPDEAEADATEDAAPDQPEEEATVEVAVGVAPAPEDDDDDDVPDNPMARVTHSNFYALRYNPLGLIASTTFTYRHRLFRRDGPLFDGAWAEVGPSVMLAPTYVATGVHAEVRPLSILGLSVDYEFMQYFGIIDALMPLSNTQQDFWEGTLAGRGDVGDNFPATGGRLTLGALFQFAYKGFVLRNQLRMLSIDMNMPAGQPYMYDATQDLVLRDGGWAVINEVDVGGRLKKWIFGARYSYADALHGTGGPGDEPMHRVGPLVAYTFHDKPAGTRFNKPTLLLLTQWYPKHPYRSGQRQHAAIPLVALAFQFTGDLWTSRN